MRAAINSSLSRGLRASDHADLCCRIRRGGGWITMFSSASIGKPNTRTGVLQVSAPYAASLAAPFGVGGLITREYNALTMPLAMMSSSSSVSLAHARHPLHKVPHRLGQTIARCTTSQSMALRAHTGAGSFGILNTFVRAGVDE